ncbi:MAG: hypothetical protein PHQ32_04635 [Firmicutes bacterium]|nr:hypothetical protein [Bacillota bacterium]
MLIESIFTTNMAMVDITTNYIAGIFSGTLQAFAWTTIVFMIIERKNNNVEEELSNKNNWSLDKLPQMPDKKTDIKLSNPIASIIATTFFATIFLALLYTAPEVFSAYFHNGKELVTIPLFNIAVLQGYRTLIIGIFILSILKEVFSIYYRKWTLKHSIIHVVLTIFTLILTIIIFTDGNLWNPDFSTELLKYMKVSLDFPRFWINIKNWILAIVVVANIIEIIGVLYKGLLHYSKEKI